MYLENNSQHLFKLIASVGVGSGPQGKGSDNGGVAPVGKKNYIPVLVGQKPMDGPGISTGPRMSRTTSTEEVL